MWKTFVTVFHISKRSLSLYFPTKSDMSKIRRVSNCVFHSYIFGKFNYVSLIIIFGTARTSRSSSGPKLEEVLIFFLQHYTVKLGVGVGVRRGRVVRM